MSKIILSVCLLLLLSIVVLTVTSLNTEDLDCSITANVVGKVKNSPKTMLASFPRSGNSYTRWMVESLSGFQTSSVYCDGHLKKSLKGECDKSLTYLVKTHYPTIQKLKPPNVKRALILVRNPFDTILSFYHYSHAKGPGSPHSRKAPEPTPEQLGVYAQTKVNSNLNGP